MIYNFLGTLLFAFSIWIIGLGFLKLSLLKDCASVKNKELQLHMISMPCGMAIVAPVVNLIYIRMGLTVGIARLVLVLLTIIGLVVVWRKGIQRKEIVGFLGMLALFCVMTLPGWIYGDQYYIYRGNIWDQYFYYSEVIYMSMHSVKDTLVNMNFPSDVLAYGRGSVLTDRPTAPLMCALLCARGFGNVFFQAYLFIVLAWSVTAGPMVLALQLLSQKWRVERKKQLITGSIGALLFVLGFYGQIQYDINAWSQMVSMAPMVSFACVFAILLQQILEKNRLEKGQWFFLVVIGLGLFLIYPENTLLQGAILGGAAIFCCLRKRFCPSGKLLGALLAIPVLMLLGCLFLDPGTFRFAFSQLQTSGTDVRQSWAEFYDRYWLGYHPFVAASHKAEVVKKLVALVPSQCGMFLLTPDYRITSRPVILLWLAALGILNIGLLLLFGGMVRKSIKKSKTVYVGFFSCVVLLGALVFGYMMLRRQYWSAGKLLLYLSPYLYCGLSFPFFRILWKRWGFRSAEARAGEGKAGSLLRRSAEGLVVVTSGLFLLCQLIFAGMRVGDTLCNKDCTGYSKANYPSDQLAVLKEINEYCFEPKKYIGQGTVAIAIEDKFYQDYVKMALTYEGIPCFGVPDTNFATATYKEDNRQVTEGDIIIEKKDIFAPKSDRSFVY